ncbi:hypothetical protein A11A3_12945 [Alcanivorax hongdengensis A-11-3]|uniref:DUF7931 domain-containing protein n=1 Tax=Alcanivorax hongdengensis A-11-3 TaxID=1177179 RepID=L0WD12_9GAMM|nr:hypothetical protein [Alcanivorax hongdengensis]EKF73635.1 hypothetical protein A11A3_12945 [Alcanivorax hongdengensis A-11-3]
MFSTLGEDDTLLHPPRSQASEALAALIAASRRRLWLRLPQLDALTADARVCDALKALALTSARVDIRVLYDDAGEAVRSGHRLIHLARRLPSRLTLKQTQEDDRDDQQCHAIGDGVALFEARGWPRPARLDLCARHLPRAPRLARDFETLWERAGGNPELRELRL